ncbi:MAG: quinolinate synthase NadA [Collinsella sp.]|nr:quinolinate synthase NadA [Collinsella sp.]
MTDIAARDDKLVQEVLRLKTERDAVILAHYYAPPAVQDVADHVGDSFALAKLAISLPQKTVVMCGVSFMGESAKLLNPDKTILLPNPAADCPMAHMVRKEDVDRVRAEHDDVAVVCYVNSTADIKSWSDVCVTSSNAVKICRELPQRTIFFIPDANLGRHVAEQLPEKYVILNDGCCPRHHNIDVAEVLELKRSHPGAPVLAHPECSAAVLEHADFIGSTSQIIDYADASDASDFIVLTVVGVKRGLERRTEGSRKRFHFPKTTPRCPDMDTITLEAVAAALRGEVPPVSVDAKSADGARGTLDAMLDYAGR